jgi:transposase InsO family protein
MPFTETTVTRERREFVEAAMVAAVAGVSLRELCQRFRISEVTGRKWRRRFLEEGVAGLEDRSRRPHHQPARVAAEVEAQICDAARAHEAWGAAKLRRWLLDRGYVMPATSTVHQVLRRHDVPRIAGAAPAARLRFELPVPNALWQMDFKGHIPLTKGGRCHPLTVLDDHSRFNLVLASCGDERRQTVEAQLTLAFQRYGLPDRMLMDNGAPWGYTADRGYTRLGAWLMRLGVEVTHGRPYHPQTQGKEERFHRTLKLEVLARRPWPDLVTVQHAFDAWRDLYNFERPHAALGLATPSTRYVPSAISFPGALPAIAYGPDDLVRIVADHGQVRFRGREYLVSRAFRGQPVGLRMAGDGVWDVYYCHQRVARIDLSCGPNEGNDVSER